MSPHANLLLTLSLSAFAGVLIYILAERLRLPAIGPLLLTGILLGPDGIGVIDPSTMEGTLKPLVSVMIALILFEGGFTLKASHWHSISKEVRGLLTIGLLVSWAGTGALVHLLFDQPIDVALLASSLVVVTGPTVIKPLLRRIRLISPLPQILQWEAVLIDPAGVFLALLCFDWLVTSGSGGMDHLIAFFARYSIGLVVGLVSGFLLSRTLHAQWIHDHTVNMFTIASLLLIYSACEAISSESGLLAVVVAGLVISLRASDRMRRLTHFKRQIVPLLIATLFVMFAANLRIEAMLELGWMGVVAVLLIILLVRPMSVWLSTIHSTLGWRHKAMLSWIAPRGIIAASMASLFSMELTPTHPEVATFLEAFTFTVIVGTILIQGLTAGWIARTLEVGRHGPGCWLVVGGNCFARGVAKALVESGNGVILVDLNPRRVKLAKRAGIPAMRSDILNLGLMDMPMMVNVEHIICLTENDIFNQLACRHLGASVGCRQTYRLYVSDEQALTHDINHKDHGCDGFGTPIWPQLRDLRSRLRAFRAGHSRVEVIATDQTEEHSPSHATPKDQSPGANARPKVPANSATHPLFMVRRGITRVLPDHTLPTEDQELTISLSLGAQQPNDKEKSIDHTSCC